MNSRDKSSDVPQRSSARGYAPVTEEPEIYATPMPQVRMRYRPVGTEVQVIERGNKRAYVHHGSRWGFLLHMHPLVYIIGTGLLIAVFMQIPGWIQGVTDNIHYGNPRTTQLDEAVGHNDSPQNPSHFIFQNLGGYVVIVEIHGNNHAEGKLYTGPHLIGDNADKIVVTGEFKDVNGDGKIDLIVHVQGQAIVYLNDGEKFNQQ